MKETIHRQLKNLEAYLKDKIEQRDWHGASDACNDIRVLEGMLEAFKAELGEIELDIEDHIS